MKPGIGITINNVGSLMFADDLVHVGLTTIVDNCEYSTGVWKLKSNIK